MEWGPSWEANRSSISQEISHILWNLKVRYLVHKRLPPFLILSQSNLVHASLSHLLKIHFSIILPSAPGSSKWSYMVSCMHLTSPPYMLHVPSISLLIWSPE